MSNIAESLLSSLDANSIRSMSSQLGLSPQATGDAIQAALPILLGQMGRNASQPEGANALFGAIQRDHGGIDIGGLLGSVLGGGASSNAPDLSSGMAILGHVFGGGGSQRASAPNVPNVPGMGGADSAKLLAMLAPLVMAVLGKMSQGGGLNAGALGGLLGGESQRISQAPPSALGGILGSVLDRDGDGQVGLGDMLGAAQGLGSLFGKR